MMTSKSVFISRYVFGDSPLRQESNFELHAQSLIQFESIEVENFPESDWYFFYSRNGVFFGLRQLVDRSMFEQIKVGTIGKGTAQQFTLMTDITPEFIGSGNAEHVAEEFLKVAEGATVTFVRASQSLQSVQETMKGKVKALDLITYHNFINEHADIPQTDIAAFTSPMNVDAYFQQKTFDTPKILIALGKSTKLAVQKYCGHQVLIPKEPSEAALKVLIDSIL